MAGAFYQLIFEVFYFNPMGLIGILVLLSISIFSKAFIPSKAWQAAVEMGCILISVLIAVYIGFQTGNAEKDFIVQKNQGSIDLSPGFRIKLVDIRSLRGVGEGEESIMKGESFLGVGDHRLNKDIQQETINTVISKIRSPNGNLDIKSMNQKQWERFLSSLSSIERRKLSNYSWAIVEIYYNGKLKIKKDVFRGDQLYLDEDDRKKGSIVIKHLFNVPDFTGDDEETIIITHST